MLQGTCLALFGEEAEVREDVLIGAQLDVRSEMLAHCRTISTRRGGGGEVIANRRSIAEGVQSGGGICRGTVLGDLARVDEEKGLVRGDDCVRDEDRIERYVRSAQIEQP